MEQHMFYHYLHRKNPFPSLIFENQVNSVGIWRNWIYLSPIFSSLDRLVFEIVNVELFISCSDSPCAQLFQTQNCQNSLC